MGSSVDQPVGIHSSLCASMGATGGAACGNSSIEKIAAAGEDGVRKNLDEVRGGDRVDRDFTEYGSPQRHSSRMISRLNADSVT
jgi:hypothetical protein